MGAVDASIWVLVLVWCLQRFVPYHWVTHGIAGIYADILNLDPFIATSLVIPVLAATGLAMLLVAILQQYIPLKSAIKAACLIPLMGVIATGRSISLDSSLLFGLAMVLVFLNRILDSNRLDFVLCSRPSSRILHFLQSFLWELSLPRPLEYGYFIDLQFDRRHCALELLT